MSRSHAFVIEAQPEEGIAIAQTWAKKELGIQIENNPDVVVMQYGLLSVADARGITERAVGAPFVGEYKILILTAHRAYHEAQNALLKVFEEPPVGTYLFLVLPTLGGLLPTLRSRVQVLHATAELGFRKPNALGVTEEFLKASKEKRSTIIKRLTSGKDEEERREHRDLAIALINGIEEAAYTADSTCLTGKTTRMLLSDIAVLRGHLYDRSAPVKMILEHLSLVMPKDLV